MLPSWEGWRSSAPGPLLDRCLLLGVSRLCTSSSFHHLLLFDSNCSCLLPLTYTTLVFDSLESTSPPWTSLPRNLLRHPPLGSYSKELLSRGRYAQLLAADNRPFNEDEEDLFNRSAQFAYESFRNKAAESRRMQVEDMQVGDNTLTGCR